MRYDRAPVSLDRDATYIVATYIRGGQPLGKVTASEVSVHRFRSIPYTDSGVFVHPWAGGVWR